MENRRIRIQYAVDDKIHDSQDQARQNKARRSIGETRTTALTRKSDCPDFEEAEECQALNLISKQARETLA